MQPARHPGIEHVVPHTPCAVGSPARSWAMHWHNLSLFMSSRVVFMSWLCPFVSWFGPIASYYAPLRPNGAEGRCYTGDASSSRFVRCSQVPQHAKPERVFSGGAEHRSETAMPSGTGVTALPRAGGARCGGPRSWAT